MDVASIPPDIRMALLLRADYATIMALCSTSTEYNDICNNWFFWMKKIQTIRPNFNPNPEVFPISRLKKFYQSLGRSGALYLFNPGFYYFNKVTDDDTFISVSNTLECIDVFGDVYDFSAAKEDTVPPQKLQFSGIIQTCGIGPYTVYLNQQGNVFLRDDNIIKDLKLSNIVSITAKYGHIYAINNLGQTYKYDIRTEIIVEINKSYDTLQVISLLFQYLILDRNGKVYLVNENSTADVAPFDLPKIKMIDGASDRLVFLTENGRVYIVDPYDMDLIMIENLTNIVKISYNATMILCIDAHGEVYLHKYGSPLAHHIEYLHNVIDSAAITMTVGGVYGLLISSE